MSSIYGLGAYSPYTQYSRYNWQSETSNSALSSAQTALSSMSGSGMLSQISSMVELTRYAMEQMGIEEDGNVTFSQISKYRNELSQSFDTELRAALKSVGIQDLNGLTFTLSADGQISVQSDNPADKQTAQAYLDAHPELGKSLLKGISDEGVTLTNSVSFRLNGGSFVVITPEAEDLSVALGDSSDIADELRSGLAAMDVGVGDGLKLTFTEDGKLAVDGSHPDADKINAWLAEESDLMDRLKELVDEAGADKDRIVFTLPFSGSLTAELKPQGDSGIQDDLKAALGETDLGKSLRDGLKAEGLIKGDETLSLAFDAAGNLVVDPETENAEAINEWLKEQTEIADSLRAVCKEQGVSEDNVAFGLTTTGDLIPSVSGQQESNDKELAAARAAFAKMGAEAESLLSGLNGLSIDPDAQFTIKLNDDGTVTIGGNHPDIEKIQEVFDNNPDLVKTYSQIEALSGLDQARAAMNISPSAMRKSLQMEGIAAAWWSGNMSNSFGAYSSSGGFNMLSGLNLSV